MTQDIVAPTSRTPRRSELDRRGGTVGDRSRRGPGLAARLLIGGGLLGCVAAGLAVTSPLYSQAKLAPAPSQAVRPVSLTRVVSAPDARRFEGAAPASPANPAALHRRENRIAAAQPVFVHSDPAPVAASQPRPAGARSHRLDPAGSSRWAAFVPAVPSTPAPATTVAQAPSAPSDRRVAAVSPSTEAMAAKSGEAAVEIASVEPDHVEVALPDLPVDALAPPQNARDALERELALAVPMPTARPFRQPSVAAAPNLRQRSRAPAGLLAYARPDAGALDDEPALSPRRTLPASPALGAGTAVYDISASTVYLPNGERLEAHSGLGSLRDDVRYVHVKNRGATPPHTYNLSMRESLFHGVAAIRLTPIGGERKIHNRNGLLAHTYMLGPRGDSNGCVSFKDYKRFLAAFKRGDIRRLVVVPSYKNPTSRIASLFGMGKR